MTHIEKSADVSAEASIGAGARIWHLAQVREGADIGAGSNIGRGAYIGPDVVLGKNCKVQNYALVYEPARLEDGVFIGPAAVLTNDLFPRAINTDGSLKDGSDWQAVGVTLHRGASIGARAVCIAPVSIGRWAMVAAGSVVTKDVADYALVAGVPARQIGWVSKAGHRLQEDSNGIFCPATGDRFSLKDGQLAPAPKPLPEVDDKLRRS